MVDKVEISVDLKNLYETAKSAQVSHAQLEADLENFENLYLAALVQYKAAKEAVEYSNKINKIQYDNLFNYREEK